MRLDYSNSKDKFITDKEIQFYDEVSLIDFICDKLYNNKVKFIISDDCCNDYGMDCKFDLPCLLEAFYDVIFGLMERRNFNIEFYEQGREYSFLFIIFKDSVKVNIHYGFNNYGMEYTLDYNYIKKMFTLLFNSIFEYANKYIIDLKKNTIFNEWNVKLDELNLQ